MLPLLPSLVASRQGSRMLRQAPKALGLTRSTNQRLIGRAARMTWVADLSSAHPRPLNPWINP